MPFSQLCKACIYCIVSVMHSGREATISLAFFTSLHETGNDPFDKHFPNDFSRSLSRYISTVSSVFYLPTDPKRTPEGQCSEQLGSPKHVC